MKQTASLLLLATALFTLSFSGQAQNELYTGLFGRFADIPATTYAANLIEKAQHGEALSQQHAVLLEDLLLTDNVIVPIGKKTVKKNVILLYMVVERKEIGAKEVYIHLKSKTLEKKTGEVIGRNAHLLDIGSIPNI
jgi:hypothetical protein